jgi:glutamate racemase
VNPADPDDGPIGLFDSGVGGLTVVAHLLQRLPEESVLYFGDTAHLPYGPRPLEEVRDYAIRIGRYLAVQGAKLVVMACNTSTSAAFDAVQEDLPVPVLGMVEYGVHAALAVARNGKVGVIATQGTVLSGAYERAFRAARQDLQVVQQACPEFVPLVESGSTDSPEALAAVQQYIEPMSAQGIDTIVLGCTHYPYLAGTIQQVVGPDVVLVDPAEALIQALEQLLDEKGLRRRSADPPTHRFLVSGDPAAFVAAAHRLLHREILVEKVDIFDAEN